MTAFVFFATGRGHAPRWSRRSIIARAVRVLGRSPWSHVAVADNQVVLNPALSGDQMYGLAWFLTEYPTLAWMVTIPGASVDLRAHAVIPPRPIRALPSILRWITGGLWPARNCLTVAVSVLRDAGIPVPRNVTTPGRLFDWLRQEGYEFTDLTGDADPSEADVADASHRISRDGG